jgi:ABC-type lipoprotein export system ATPase subunit
VITHVHQKPTDNLLGHLSVEQQLARVASRTDAPGTVDESLEVLKLSHRRHELPGRLSGGEQQRVAVARALVSGHRLVVADEPTSQLDGPNAGAVLDAFSVLAERGTAVVMATHDKRLLDRVEHVISMRDGAITSISQGDTSYAVIDRSGRLQLPPAARHAFPERRARISFDAERGRLEVDQP